MSGELVAEHRLAGLAHDVAVDAAGDRLAVATDDEVRILDVSDPRRPSIAGRIGSYAQRALFSPDGARLAIAGDGEVRVVALASGDVVATHEIEYGSVRDVAWAADGEHLAVATRGVALWSITDGRVLRTLEGTIGRVSCVRIDAAGRWLAVGDNSSVTRVWRRR